MTTTSHELLAELGWLRTLARRLTRDPELADDLVQDACAVALAQSAPPRSWRAWLATIVPNLLHGHHRREAARRRRQPRDDGRGPSEDTARVLQRAETQHRLAAAVLRLDEPYRSTVLLRFFDGEPPRRIAAIQQVPVTTVHSRLQRALAQLRTELDHDFGGRSSWLAAFAPFAWPKVAPVASTILLMQTNVKLFAAVAAVLCSAPFWWPTSSPATATEPVPVADAGRRGMVSGHGDSGDSGGAPVRATRREAVEPAAPAPTPAMPQFAGSGRVCDCRGQALAGVPITVAGRPQPIARSDSLGTFTFALAERNAELQALGGDFVTVLAGAWAADATIATVVVVAPSVRVGGRVVDESGAPVPANEVVLQLPADFDTRFPMPLDRAERRRWTLRGDRDGNLAPRALPRIDGASLLCTADAFAPSTVPLPLADDEHLQIVMHPFHYAEGELRGRVVDPSGAPAPGARVAMGVTSVVSAADGTFSLSLLRAGWPTAIVAAKAGHLPARCEIPRRGGTQPSDWPQPLELRLGPAPKSVRGRVVDQDGNGLAKAEVWIADPTPLGIAGLLPMQLEYLLAGGPVPPQAARMPVPHADAPTTDGHFMDNASVVPAPTACWYYATTDENGAFELGGLLDRPYSLRALDVTTGLFGDANDVFGGATVDVVIRREHVWPELRGRVVSLRGEGIGGVEVKQSLVAFQHQARVPGGRFEGTALREGASTVTAADGSFVLRGVGSRRCNFVLSGDAVLPRSVRAEDIADPLHCVLPAQARCQVEVVLADAQEADEVTCFDAAGKPLDLAVLRRNSNAFLTELPLHDGRSGVFVVGEAAAKLVLTRGGQPVREIPFTPDPRRTTTLQ